MQARKRSRLLATFFSLASILRVRVRRTEGGGGGEGKGEGDRGVRMG